MAGAEGVLGEPALLVGQAGVVEIDRRRETATELESSVRLLELVQLCIELLWHPCRRQAVADAAGSVVHAPHSRPEDDHLAATADELLDEREQELLALGLRTYELAA